MFRTTTCWLTEALAPLASVTINWTMYWPCGRFGTSVTSPASLSGLARPAPVTVQFHAAICTALVVAEASSWSVYPLGLTYDSALLRTAFWRPVS